MIPTHKHATEARIQKSGSLLVLPIPKALADEAGLKAGTPVELSFENGKLVVKIHGEEGPTLEELLRGVTKDNVHGEWDTGKATGREVW